MKNPNYRLVHVSFLEGQSDRIAELERKLQERREALEFQNRNVVKATENYDRLCKQLAAKDAQLKVAIELLTKLTHLHLSSTQVQQYSTTALKQIGVGDV